MTTVQVEHSAAGAAFQYPNFRLFQTARFLMVAGLEMQSVAVGWQIYEITRRPLDLGLVGLAQFLPGLLLFLLGGHVADRFDRRRILLACYSSFALCSLALLTITLRGIHGVAPVYLVLVPSALYASSTVRRDKLSLRCLVPAAVFPNAAAWGSSIFNAATILGPVIGGVLYALRGNPEAVYLTAAAALAASVLLMLPIRVNGVQQISQGRDWNTVLAGFQYVWRNKLILGTTTLDLFAVLLGGAVALLPVFARETSERRAAGLGLLRASPGLALDDGHRDRLHPSAAAGGSEDAVLCCGFGAATIVFGLSRNLYLSMFALFLVGAADMVSVIVRSTVVQLATPDEMRGRVSAVICCLLARRTSLDNSRVELPRNGWERCLRWLPAGLGRFWWWPCGAGFFRRCER